MDSWVELLSGCVFFIPCEFAPVTDVVWSGSNESRASGVVYWCAWLVSFLACAELGGVYALVACFAQCYVCGFFCGSAYVPFGSCRCGSSVA